MNPLELILLALGLAMDAFAVAVCKGLSMTKLNYRNATIIALFFGMFQALMPLLGWLLGSQFSSYISAYSHWVVFVLLTFIGGRMIYGAMTDIEEDKRDGDKLDFKELFILALATSIDALAVGISFALMPNSNILVSVATIGIITFLLSFLGVVIGNRFGREYKSRAELFGGAILIAIGLKTLIEQLIDKV